MSVREGESVSQFKAVHRIRNAQVSSIERPNDSERLNRFALPNFLYERGAIASFIAVLVPPQALQSAGPLRPGP